MIFVGPHRSSAEGSSERTVVSLGGYLWRPNMRNRSALLQSGGGGGGGAAKSIRPVFIGLFSADTCFANIIAQ